MSGDDDRWVSVSGVITIVGTFFTVLFYRFYQGGTANGWMLAAFACGVLTVVAFVITLMSSVSDEKLGYTQPHVSTARASRSAAYMSDLMFASKMLFSFLCELNRNARCRSLLEQLPGIDNIKSNAEVFTISDRLAVIAYCDVQDCFRRLGHSLENLNSLEGMGYCSLVLQLASKNFDIKRLTNVGQRKELVKFVEKLAKEKCALSIEGREAEYRFVVIFGDQFHEYDWVQRYATLMYRWASLISKADGKITVHESKALEEIMKIRTGKASSGNIKVSSDKKNPSNILTVGNTVSRNEDDTPKPRVGLRSALKKLDELIGLAPVKNEVRQLTSFIEIQAKRRARGLKVAPVSYHCVFTGNPGTGKTTVARILAEIYRATGIVKKGHLVETDRSGLIAEYVGQTAVKTNKIIDSALDGVLFIDEAYSLVQGGERDYGGEAIATLLKRMEDDRDRLVVILAGYTREMKDFIDSNPGLQSRFTRYIEFSDYSAEELAKIFLLTTEKCQYVCDDEVHSAIVQIMERALQAKDKNFGNARFVRNLFEKSIQRQATRLSTVAPITQQMLSELTLHDLGYKFDDN